MKGLPRLLLLSAIFATASFAQKVGAQQFSITISTPKSEVSAGAPVWVTAKLTNSSEHEIGASAIRSSGVDISYEYYVREISGKSVEKVNHRNMGKHIQSVLTRTLKPNESTEENLLVSRVYNMNLPGQYEIQLSRPVSDDPKDGVLLSNKIIVTVTP